MAGARRAGIGVLQGLGKVADRGMREMQGFGRDAEAAAHQAYKDAIRTGADLVLRTQGEVNRYGANLLAAARDATKPMTRYVTAPKAPKGSPSRPASADPFQRLVSDVAAGQPQRSIDPADFVSRPATSRIDAAARPPSLVKIGGQYYGERDDGRANVLVPIADPTVPEAVRLDQQRALQRALFMADRPLAGAGYALATLAGAPQDRRDGAMLLGGLADTALLGGAGLGAASRRPAAPRPGMVPPPQVRPSIRFRPPAAKGQAGGMSATLTSDMLGSGSRARPWLKPPGWRGDGEDLNQARGHILGKQLGGGLVTTCEIS